MKIKWFLPIFYLTLGSLLIVLSFFGKVESFGNGIATALIVIGTMRLIQTIRYKSNPQYKESVDIAAKDERNHFIRTQAWAWAGYVYILIAAVATIVFKLIDQELLMFAACGSVYLLLVLHWIVYLILRKKY